ncbi:MAG: hydrolase [Gemmatimonadota bacterium]|nr:MAG: hydrolase [Gemmatimonadota bacterium]
MMAAAFRPAWWLPGPHCQTLAARVLRMRLRVEFRRERLELDDGDFLDLDWVVAPESGEMEGRPLVIVLHGLEGSAGSGYARQMYRELTANGLQAVGLNFRGCSGEPNRLPRAYHSGDTGDLAYVVRLLQERDPQRPIGAAGFSLGGNLLLKYLGEDGDGIGAAVAISVPFDLSAGADHIERGFSKTYRAFLVRKLQRKIRAKARVMDGTIDLAGTAAARTFREFDDAVIVPIHGFEDAEDYYRRSSSAQFLESITTATLLIHSLDDPFLPAASVPTGITEENPHVQAEFTRRGGHVGFVSGHPWAPLFWGERRAAEFLDAKLAGGA